MKENIALISCIVLILILVLALFLDSKKTNDLNEVNREVELKVSNYRLEKKKYQDELAEVKSQYREEILGKSRLMLLFYEMERSFFDEVYSIMSEHNAVGTFCISKNNIPGINSDITFEEFNTLLANGWQSAIYWDGTDDINLWYIEITRLMSEIGIEIPSTLFIHESNNNYANNLAFEELGFKNIVVKKDDFNLNQEISLSSLHQINAVGWFTTTAAGTLQTLTNKSDEATFVVGLTNQDEKFEESQFNSMIAKIDIALSSNKVMLTTFDEAEEYRLELKDKKDAEESTYLDKIQELERKIQRIDLLIENEYNN
ncbi:MAG: hypothetical protein E7582_07045 [Ruminococcaceae bacterium]|nr:hypothetical protein [Oscillospiraceae bacterium]